MPCTPNGVPLDPSCVNQLLSIDNTIGDLAISGGNTVNLCSVTKLCETKTVITSFSLTGTLLQIVYVGEDGVPQAKTVDLSSLVPSATGLLIENTNSIQLSFDGNNLRADLLVDPTSTLPISSSPAGVKFMCCPETPVTSNISNTVQLITAGNGGHVLTANLKYQSSQSLAFSDSSAGLTGIIKYSTDASNAASAGSDGALYVQTASAQLATLPNNGFITTGSAGTLLVGSDSKLYRIPDLGTETPITPVDTNTVNLTVSGPNNHTLQADVKTVNSPTVQLTSTVSGLQADIKIDNGAPGNIVIGESANGLVANINAATIQGIQTSVATVQNPVTKVYGTLNNNSNGYAAVFISQYGLQARSFTTTQRFAIPNADLYDTLTVFDSTLRKFMWYDAVNAVWVQFS